MEPVRAGRLVVGIKAIGGTAPGLTNATSVVGARLIARMVRDLGRERGFILDEVAWLPDPEKWQVDAYVLAVSFSGQTQRQIFPREHLESAVRSDLMRGRIATALRSLLGAFSICYGQRRSA